MKGNITLFQMKRRIVKISSKQMSDLSEDVGVTFNSDNDVPNFNGCAEITVSGKKDQGTYGKPVSTDKIARKLTPQTFSRYGMTNFRGGYRYMPESYQIDTNSSDSFYDNTQMDTLSNGIEDDNTTVIPQSVDAKIDLLCNVCNTANLTPRQNAMIINKLIEALPMKGIPFKWRNELIIKIRNGK